MSFPQLASSPPGVPVLFQCQEVPVTQPGVMVIDTLFDGACLNLAVRQCHGVFSHRGVVAGFQTHRLCVAIQLTGNIASNGMGIGGALLL